MVLLANAANQSQDQLMEWRTGGSRSGRKNKFAALPPPPLPALLPLPPVMLLLTPTLLLIKFFNCGTVRFEAMKSIGDFFEKL
ncbi:hypothetical protein V6N13_131186 [Hibiscus sabdariffa]|uniref:Uncharacterized protein n=1 Tax=Hibiscus sabdariffa TaxID=183260 RepID=A0ABR2D761_9ROSI